MLEALEAKLSSKQLEARALGFEQARRFINNAAAGGGVCAPVSQSFPKYSVIRVDIEVKEGRAFVP